MTDQLRQLESLLQRLKEGRAALERPGNVSSRTPQTIFTDFNAADNIERQLRADGHVVWGFVVYRCSYGSDNDWATVVRRLNEYVRRAMDTYNGHDLLESWRLTIFDDQERFNGASTQVVREHFRQWAATAVEEEQGPRDAIEARCQEPEPWFGTLALRYRFCIQVDEAALQSIVSEGEPTPIVSEGWVNLIKGDWRPRAPAEAAKEEPRTGKEENEFEEDENEIFDSIEGCTEEDVGWMRVQIQSVMPDFYVNLREISDWLSEYRRPPTVVTA